VAVVLAVLHLPPQQQQQQQRLTLLLQSAAQLQVWTLALQPLHRCLLVLHVHLPLLQQATLLLRLPLQETSQSQLARWPAAAEEPAAQHR
jgi:hypothetical protein